MAQIIVDIDANGSVKMDVSGVKGSSCEKLTEHIEVAVGGSVKAKKKKKPEYYASSGSKTTQQVF